MRTESWKMYSMFYDDEYCCFIHIAELKKKHCSSYRDNYNIGLFKGKDVKHPFSLYCNMNISLF